MYGRRSTRDDEFAFADSIVTFLIMLVFGVFIGIGRLIAAISEGFAPLPTGIPIGYVTNNMGFKRVVGIVQSNTFKHTAIAGATGSGKTTLLKRVISEYANLGFGIVLVDPKGDMLQECLSLLPEDRARDVVIVDPTDTAHPVCLDMLERVEADMVPLAASELLNVFKKVLGATFGVRMEGVLRNALLALLEVPDATLLDLRPFFLDADFRNRYLAHCTNPTVVSYWQDEYAAYSRSQQLQMVAPVLNRVGYFTSYPIVRNMLCAKRGTISIKDLMDQGKILLVSVPATLGEDVASFLGTLIVSKCQLATMQRAGIAEQARRPCIICIDEAQNFVSNDAFARIITEARSMRVGFIICTQFFERLPQELRQTIARNVATVITCYMENGQHKLVYQQPQDVGVSDLIVTPYPPPSVTDTNLAQAIRRESRRRYSRSRVSVEQEIFRQVTEDQSSTNGIELFVPEPYWSTPS